MFAALPLIASFILLFVVFLRVGGDWRKSFLSAAIVWGLALTAITEILSLLNSFTFPWVEISWLVVVLLLCMIVASLRKKIPNPFSGIPNSLVGLLAGISCIFFMVGLIALTAPPNTWDSMTYHMSRVAHWVQNGNVSFYPTHILRQLYQPPWAEFAIAHLQVLSGGDRFANLIQWFSMVGCALGVSLIARQLGAKLQGQVFAAVFCATIPMGILQGSSTQNDYVVSFWLVCFVYFLMTFKANRQWADLLAGSISLGLAILTKGTAYIYASPFLAWYFWTGIKELRWSLWKPIVIIPIFVLLINLGHYQRNMSLFGSPIASTDVTFNNEIFTLKAFISNLSRNLSLHLGTFGPINALLENGIVKLHAFINTDINDTRTTWQGNKFHVRRLLPHEDLSGNPAHLFLIAVSVVLFLMSKKQKSSDGLAGYLIAVTAAFLLFVLYLKWQPWHSRLHLPIFVLFSAFSGTVLSNISRQKIVIITLYSLILLSSGWVFLNISRPVFGIYHRKSIFVADRTSLYFYNRPNLKASYIKTASTALSHGCSSVGLVMSEDDWEYPHWVLLHEKSRNVRIEHSGVRNRSSIMPSVFSPASENACIINLH